MLFKKLERRRSLNQLISEVEKMLCIGFDWWYIKEQYGSGI